MRFRLILLLHLLLCTALTATERGVGWRYDGSGRYPDTLRLPATFDGTSGRGIRWRARLPNWSNSSPVVAAGRVYVMSEPLGYAPELLCFDAGSGDERWRVPVDPVDTFPPGEREALREDLAAVWEYAHTLLALSSRFCEGDKSALAEARKLGVKDMQVKMTAGGYASCVRGIDHPLVSTAASLAERGLVLPSWNLRFGKRKQASTGCWVGMGFPTPVTDGERVWVVTGYNHYACYTRDGKLVWQRRFPIRNRRAPAEDFATSPLLADGVLVCNGGRVVRALDAATGEVRWEHEEPLKGHGQCMGNPAFLELDGTGYVVSAMTGTVLRLRDGRRMASVAEVEGVSVQGKSTQAGPLIAGDAILGFFATKDRAKRDDLAILRFAVEGDAGSLASSTVALGRKERPYLYWAVVADGHLYGSSMRIDLAAGKAERYARNKNRSKPLVAGDTVLAFSGGYHTRKADKRRKQQDPCSIVVRDLAGGEVISEGELPLNPEGGADETQKRRNAHNPWWAEGTKGLPCPHRGRLYVRTHDYLWCIGN